MDALLLARIQFGISIGFHYLFPVTTLGLTLFIVIFETLFIRKKEDSYRIVSDFLIKLLGLVFTLGVATGLLMPFAIGANWARFSGFAGPIFGAALAVEAVTAFALESAFLAILVFGRKKVSPFVYWLSAFLVFFGAHLSAFLIVAANSWMQTPAGYAIQNGQTVLTSAFQAVFNPSTLIRFVHVTTAAWLTGAFIIAGLGAYYAFKGRFTLTASLLLRIALPIALVTSVSQPFWGHFHILNVLQHNPEKDAAYEGIFKTTRGATLYSFGIPDEENRVIRFAVGIPYALSFLESGDPMSEVKGLEEFPREDWPPVNIIFTTFHLMVMLGIVLILVSGVGVFLLWRKKLVSARWYLKWLPVAVPFAYLANELGWAGAEIGRQPWIIYKVLRTAQASSVMVPAWQTVVTLAGLCCLYAVILGFAILFLGKMVLAGPEAGKE